MGIFSLPFWHFLYIMKYFMHRNTPCRNERKGKEKKKRTQNFLVVFSERVQRLLKKHKPLIKRISISILWILTKGYKFLFVFHVHP